MSFKFVDLFAGIGGFHGALSALGGTCVYASEIDRAAARVYVRNWGMEPDGDITLAANEFNMDVPEHDVLVGGFPCQPFSKSGKQRGMDEARGTLFWNIAKIIEVRQPKIVLLENVRNIAGPRHTHEWEVIIQTLRELGYRVSSKPLVVSPHRIHPNFGGRPQVRERVFIAATRINAKVSSLSEEPELPSLEQFENGWDPQKWSLSKHLPLETKTALKGQSLDLSEDERKWISVWDEFVTIYKKKNPNQNLPGFPIWVDEWKDRSKLRIPAGTPEWKENFLIKNSDLYTANKKELDTWLKKHNNLQDFPPSRRKFEWQAQDAKSLYDTIMHFRPSGIRAKKATYVPAMVAITQTSIVGKHLRRISIREGSRLQGLPEWFDFMDQPASATYKQLGNGVNVDALAALLVLDPGRFDVILGSNLFGDILSDLAAALVGSIGIAPCGNIDPTRRNPSMFEPIHGSAPDIVGKGIANPIGQIWSAAMMLEHLQEFKAASGIIAAIESVIVSGIKTPDLGGSNNTDEVTDAVISAYLSSTGVK